MTEPPIDPGGEPEPSDDKADSSDPDRAAEERAEDQQESAPEYVDDNQLPEDLRPSKDNPLAVNEDE